MPIRCDFAARPPLHRLPLRLAPAAGLVKSFGARFGFFPLAHSPFRHANVSLRPWLLHPGKKTPSNRHRPESPSRRRRASLVVDVRRPSPCSTPSADSCLARHRQDDADSHHQCEGGRERRWALVPPGWIRTCEPNHEACADGRGAPGANGRPVAEIAEGVALPDRSARRSCDLLRHGVSRDSGGGFFFREVRRLTAMADTLSP